MIDLEQLTPTEEALLAQYDDIVFGRAHSIDAYFFEGVAPVYREKLSLMLIQYWVERYLRLTPQQMYERITYDMLKEWGLSSQLRYITFPPELDPKRDVFYLAHLIYPKVIVFHVQDTCLHVYKDLLAKRISKYPKGFFENSTGYEKICYCLRYAIEQSNVINNTCVEDMYRFFGTKDCLKFLRDYRLAIPIRTLFDSPVTAFHMLVPPEQDNEFVFQLYRYNWILENNVRMESERRGKKAVRPHSEHSRKDDAYANPV